MTEPETLDNNDLSGNVRLLFRFRDLVAPTIQEHQQIIATHGSCWWGWWKRPSEDSRKDVWLELGMASDDTPVSVGLFDSGTGKVYRALVTAVIPPSEHLYPPNIAPTLDHKSLELVPSYYRESPFSSAWMRLKAIEAPIDFFKSFSFEEPPRLPNYSPSTLERLAGKVILSPEELRGMDTTIWRVRPKRQGDHSEEIILSIPRLPAAISSEVVRCKSDYILHLSDLHFATGTNRTKHVWRLESERSSTGPTMVEAISNAIKAAGTSIGLVLVTGDLSFVGDSQEFQEATTSLSRLLGNLDLSTDHLVVVPGNHDIQWTTDSIYNESAKVIAAPPAATENYINFYRELFRHDPSNYLAMGRRYLLPSGLALDICALNSSSLETGKHFLAGMGRIQEDSFVGTANELGWTKYTSNMALRILAIHHHLVSTEDFEPAEGYLRGYGLAVDATRIQRAAARAGVHLVLHGHKHRVFVWRSVVYELPEFAQTDHQLGALSILGGGSAGSIETESASNFFNLMKMDATGVWLAIYRSKSTGSFDRIQHWVADLSVSSAGRLALGEWRSPAKTDA